MRITKKLIAQTCLPIYKEVLVKGKKDNKDRFLQRLDKSNTDYGICNLYDSLPNPIGNIYLFRPISQVCKVNRYGQPTYGCCWYTQIPITCNSKKEMVDCINKRVQLLESWL